MFYEPPYSLSSSLVNLIFVIYVVGTFSSTFMEHLADNYGEHKVLCIALLTMFIGAFITLDMKLLLKIISIANIFDKPTLRQKYVIVIK